MNPTADATDAHTRPGLLKRVPIYVWLLIALGGVAGALLAEPGDFWGNTVPSTLTFMLAGLVIGLVAWVILKAVRR
jgi:hypothetical protein